MKKTLIASTISLFSLLVYAEVPKVVTTIKPLHSLVAQVMDGVSQPDLLIDQGSPHGYQMKPNDAKALAHADLVIWVSNDLETFMEKALRKNTARKLNWSEIDGIKLLKNRAGGLWEEHEHNDHEHEEYDHEHGDHEHEEHDHEHGDHEHEEHEHHHEHHHGINNAHLWLGIDNASVLVNATAQTLAELDPEHAKTYQQNAQKTLDNLNAQKTALKKQLSGLDKKPYMVFHDAYHYFEQDFGLNAVGVVRVDPEHEPGLKDIEALRKQFTEHKIVCIFKEPQFPSTIVDKLAQGSKVKTGTLDPIGADLPADQSLYQKLMQQLADNLTDCLK